MLRFCNFSANFQDRISVFGGARPSEERARHHDILGAHCVGFGDAVRFDRIASGFETVQRASAMHQFGRIFRHLHAPLLLVPVRSPNEPLKSFPEFPL